MFSLRTMDKMRPCVRNFARSSFLRESEKAASPSEGAVPVQHRVSDFEKRLLVWVKRYKTIEEVPSRVSVSVIEKAKSRARIRVANYMTIATMLGCLLYAWSGRRAAQRGESVQKMNLEWHRDFNVSDINTIDKK